MLSTLRLSTATTRITTDMSVTNQSSYRTLIMNIIFMTGLAVLVLVAQPTLAGMGKDDAEAISQSDGMRKAIAALNKGDFQNAYDLLDKERVVEKDGKIEINQELTNYQLADIHYLQALSLIGRDGKGQDLVLDDPSDNLDQNAYVRRMHDRAAQTHLTRALARNPRHQGALFKQGMLQVFHENSKSFYGDTDFKGSSDMLALLEELCTFNCGDIDTLEKAIKAAKATTPYVGLQLAKSPPELIEKPMVTTLKGSELIALAQKRFKTKRRPTFPGSMGQSQLRKANQEAKDSKDKLKSEGITTGVPVVAPAQIRVPTGAPAAIKPKNSKIKNIIQAIPAATAATISAVVGGSTVDSK